MPHKTYKHFCTVSGYEFSTGQKICWRCGGVGEYEGWGLSMVEHWCLYVRKTGFAPMGPHRHLVDSLFYDHWEQCGECDGLGIKQSPDHEDEWVDCTACDGKKGGRWTGTEYEWNRMIYDVVAAYPDMIGGACIDEYTAIYEAFKKDLKRKMNKNKSTGIGKLKNKIQALVKRRTAV